MKMTFSKLLVLCLFLGNAWGFTLNTTNGASYDVKEIVVDLADNCQNLGITDTKLAQLIQQAMDDYWNTIPVSSLKMSFGQIVTVSGSFYTEPLCDSYSGGNCNINSNLIYMGNQVLVACNDEYTQSAGASNNNGFNDASILGLTVNNNMTGDQIQSSVFLINDLSTNLFKSLDDEAKIGVLAHELGHAIGLGHSQVEEALMWYQRVPGRHALGWDDIDGASYLYPASQPMNCGNTESPNIPSMLAGMLLIFFGAFIFKKLRKSQT